MSALPEIQHENKQRWTQAEYLAFDRASDTKHELINGQIVAMTGASRWHNLAASGAHVALGVQLRGKPCELYQGDMRVQVSEDGEYYYPDLVVVCGEPQFVDTGLETLTNPTLIIEVLSESTERHDRGVKSFNYRQLESLQDYVLIWQNRPQIERYTREDDGTWKLLEVMGLDATMPLPSIEGELALADVYAKVDFEAVGETGEIDSE